MNRAKSLLLAIVVALGVAGAVGARAQPDGAGAGGGAGGAMAAELTSRAWLGEVMRYLYRWQIDERDVDAVVRADQVVFWVRELKPALDEGDRSLFGEVVLPQFSLAVKVKRADYTIPELNATVKSPTFRITHVGRIEAAQQAPAGFVEIRADYTDLRDELFRTRRLAAFPEGELLERLRGAARRAILKDLERAGEPAPTEKQIVHMAPLSPVANETWVYWENRRTLIRFASDIDLSNPAVWEHETLAVRLFPLEQKVVVSLDEVTGSNAFMTRDEAGRALFNCMVLGKRVELQPPAPEAQPPAAR